MGNGSTSVFTYAFVADEPSDIEVLFTNSSGGQTVLTSSQYILTQNAVPIGGLWSVGGTLTYPITGSPIATGTSLTIQRVLPFQQLTTITDQGPFNPQVIETALDTLCMEIQQVAARTGAFRGTWATNITYNFGDIVVDGVNGSNTTNWYSCNNANTSGVWATDLANGDWSLILNLQSIANPGTVAAGGDLTGNYPNPTISSTFLQRIYPVGSLYFNASVSTNPATFLGFGTWTAFGGGQVPIGVGSFTDGDGNSETITAGQQIGEYQHTLITNEMPSHTHTVTDPGHMHSYTQTLSNNQAGGSSGSFYNAGTSTANTGSATTGITLANTGGGAAHNNIQPSIGVYIWKRSA